MTKGAPSVEHFARRRLGLSFELRAPIAECLERHPIKPRNTLASLVGRSRSSAFRLIELTLDPRLMARSPKSLVVTSARDRCLSDISSSSLVNLSASDIKETSVCEKWTPTAIRAIDRRIQFSANIPCYRLKIPCSPKYFPC